MAQWGSGGAGTTRTGMVIGTPEYVRLDAAVALALLGQRDEGTVAVLRRVMTPTSYFPLSQSNMELGAACIGLALLGDRDSRPRILEATRQSYDGIDRDAALALQVLDAGAR